MLIDQNKGKIHSKELFDLLLSVSITLYIFFLYMGINRYLLPLNSASLYIFIGLTGLFILTKQSVRISVYSLWYFLFIFLSLLSYFYAVNPTYALQTLYLLAINLVLVFAFIHYARTQNRIRNIILLFAYSGVLLAAYLFVSGQLRIGSVRLGMEVFGFYNSNSLAMLLMISLFCVFWLIIFGNKKQRLFNILSAIFLFYTTALTGGRKYLVVPFLFLSILLFYKHRRDSNLKKITTTVFFVIIIVVAVLSIIEIPELNMIIGDRFVGLFNLFRSNSRIDDSTNVRYQMIRFGWDYFKSRPILGYGLNNYKQISPPFFGEQSYSHNNYIELLVNLGLIGFLLYYSYYFFVISKLSRYKSDPTGLSAFFLAFIFSLLVFEIGGVTYTEPSLQIFLGLAAAYLIAMRKTQGKMAQVE